VIAQTLTTDSLSGAGVCAVAHLLVFFDSTASHNQPPECLLVSALNTLIASFIRVFNLITAVFALRLKPAIVTQIESVVYKSNAPGWDTMAGGFIPEKIRH
jgi:RsiW-degrading membrane proteinase PrsW (M82 family)